MRNQNQVIKKGYKFTSYFTLPSYLRFWFKLKFCHFVTWIVTEVKLGMKLS